jgi:hypothetical protein
MPNVVGDPVFGTNGSISSTPQQAGISVGGFVGQMLSGSEEVTALREAPRFIESIGVNGSINEVTSLPSRIPKGGAAIIGVTTLVGINWLMGGVNGWDESPTELEIIKALANAKKILGSDANKASVSTNLPKVSGSSVAPGAYMSTGGSQSYQAAFSPFRGTLGLPAFVSSAASKGYGSSGTTYTSFVAPNAFSACGTLCK